ncbi:MAG: hypothetical protein R3C45_19165 [Phycisphaerales bacterium]
MSRFKQSNSAARVSSPCALPQISSGAHGQTLGGFMSHVGIGVAGGQVLVFKDEPALIPDMIGPTLLMALFRAQRQGLQRAVRLDRAVPFDLQGNLIWIELLEQTRGLQTFQGGFASDSGGPASPTPAINPWP